MSNRLALCVLLAGTTFLTTGCSTRGFASRDRAIVRELTPELRTLTQRPVDTQAMAWHTWNADWRMFYGDFYRAAHLNRPSHLAPTTIPH
jgi:hypothetical protein